MGRLLIQLPGTTTAKALTETLSKNVIIVDEDLHQLRLHDGTTAGGHLIGGSSGSGVPVGTIIPFAGNSVPQGYLLCDGSAISRTTYASLFAVIGTIYGTGDGNSTFNLPSAYDGRALFGVTSSEVGYKDEGSLPNIVGNIGLQNDKFTQYGGCFEVLEQSTRYTNGINPGGTGVGRVRFNAHLYSSLYSTTNSTKVIPARIQVLFCIKY